MSYCDVDLKIVFTFNDLTIFPVYIFVFKLQLEGKCCTREKLGKKNLCISQSIYALWMTLLVESKELSECVYIKKSPMACCEPLHCNFFFPFPTGNRLRVTKKIVTICVPPMDILSIQLAKIEGKKWLSMLFHLIMIICRLQDVSLCCLLNHIGVK